MKCNDYNEQLSVYVDGMLNEAEEKVLKAHLETCEACRDTLVALQEIKEHMQAMDAIVLPDTFHQQLMTTIHTETDRTKEKGLKHTKGKMIGYLSTLAAAALIMVWVGTANRPPATQPDSASMIASEAQQEKPQRSIEPMAAPVAEQGITNNQTAPTCEMKIPTKEDLDANLEKWTVANQVQLLILTPGEAYELTFPDEATKGMFEDYVKEHLGGEIQSLESLDEASIKIIVVN